MENQYCVYIVTNMGNRVLYTGVTNDLKRRVFEHKEKLNKGFTTRYRATKLVCYEIHGSLESAIFREKQINAGKRKSKIDLINNMNKSWIDLYPGL